MATQAFLVGTALTLAVLFGRFSASRLGVPDAAAYVVVGALAGLVPGLSEVRLSPELVLLVFLPPLLHYAAFFSDPRETVDHLGSVVGQAVGLVLVSALAGAAVLLAFFPDIGWPAALAFGAAIAPPDPVAATNVLQRAGAPRRLVTVLEGEGLVNDGVALTLYSLAVASVGAALTPATAALRVVAEVGGGVGFGLAVGWCIARLRRRMHDGTSQVVLSLATPYLAFVPAYLLHASGVLAAVTAAVWLGSRGRGLVAPTARLRTETFWGVLNLLLVAFLFVLLGLQVPGMASIVREYSAGTLLAVATALVVATVLVRLGWVMGVLPGLARLSRAAGTVAALPRNERLVLGWCGPRGAVSLAVILTLPLNTPSGTPFPHRDLMIFLTMTVVLATLVAQTALLPALLRALRLSRNEHERTEGLRARRATMDAALRELDNISARDEHNLVGVEALRQMFELRRDRLHSLLDIETGDAEEPAARPDDRSLRLHLLAAQRDALRHLYEKGEISGRTRIEVGQELDLDEARLRGRHSP